VLAGSKGNGDGGAHLFLENEDLGSDCLDLCNNRRADKLLQRNLADVVDQAQVEPSELETREIKLSQDTLPGQLENSLELRQLDQSLDVKLLVREKASELVDDVKVVNLAELTEELEVQAVDVEKIVQVLVLETTEVVDPAEVVVAALLSRGSSGQGGQGRDEDGGNLHFCWCGRVKDSGCED